MMNDAKEIFKVANRISLEEERVHLKIVSSKVPRFKFQSRFIDYFQIAYKKLRTRFLDTSHVIFEAKILKFQQTLQPRLLEKYSILE